MDCILKGDMSITDNIDFIRDIIYSPPNDNVKVISVEEVPTIDTSLPNVIGGAFILPPIDAMMAAANGDEEAFYNLYIDHMNTAPVMDFVSLLISALYRGISLILFFPVDDLDLKKYILDIFWKRYGIMIGEIGIRPCQYDITATPIWLESTFETGIIDPIQFLQLYPKEADIQDRMIYKLVMAINPIADTYQEKANYINSLKFKLKEKPNLKIPFREYVKG